MGRSAEVEDAFQWKRFNKLCGSVRDPKHRGWMIQLHFHLAIKEHGERGVVGFFADFSCKLKVGEKSYGAVCYHLQRPDAAFSA